MPRGVFPHKKGIVASAETKIKMSESRLKRKEILGYINSPETRVKLSQSLKGHSVSEETRRKIGEANSITLKGRKLTEEHKRKVSESLKGHRAWSRGVLCYNSTKEKISKALKGRATRGTGWHHPEEYRRKKALMYAGEKSHFWRGGLTPENKRVRNSAEFAAWRTKVFARDNWTCQKCGIRDGGELHPHHILPFAEYPELRFEVNNGITLHKDCHQQEHRHRIRGRNPRALAELRKP